jgi:MFS family permease
MSDGAARWRALVLLSLAEMLALSLWFSASAVLPALSREWSLGDGGRAGLTIAVQAGFIVGTLAAAVTNLPDIVPPRALMMWGAVAGALVNAVLALWVEQLTPALVLRFLTGVCLAGTYPPAMKIAATWFREGRGLAIGLLVAALTVGSAAPHLIRGLTDLPWRHTLLAASVAAGLGALAVTLVTEGPHRFPPARFDLGMAAAVLRERGPRLACFGYFGHMWELYALWAFVPAYVAAYAAGAPPDSSSVSLWSFLIIGAGAIGCIAGGLMSLRRGSARIAFVQLGASGVCCLLSPIAFWMPEPAVLGFLVFWGIVVAGDSPQFSALNARYAPSALVGSALTIVNCIGFAITIVSIQLLNGAMASVGAQYLFLFLLPGPVLGLLALLRLVRSKEAEFDAR